MSFITEDIVRRIITKDTSTISELKWDIRKETFTKGYCSDSFYIRISYKLSSDEKVHEKHLFIKDPYNSALYPKLENLGLYEKELYMYEKVIPALHRLLGEECLAPKFYYTDSKHALVLEDLSRDNYCVLDRHQQLDFEHCIKSLKHLAKLHAASVKLNQVSPEVLENTKHAPAHHRYLLAPEGRDYFLNQLKAVFKSTYAAEVQINEDKFKNYENKFVDKLIMSLSHPEGAFGVLVHADSWLNNIMFKYDKYHDIESIKLIDFQLCYWASPLIDLYYFFITCVKFATFERYFEVLLEVYVDTLNRVLHYLKCDVSVSLRSLKADFQKMSDYGVFVVVHPLSMAMADDQDMRASNVDVEKHVQNEPFKGVAVKWLRYFDNKGVFS